MMSSQTELEEQLLKVGKKLLQPPTAVDELLPLLDQAEALLFRVEQSPPRPMQSTLSLSIKALVEDELFKHSDIDVKVAVASCISEITRITAPDTPYDDDKMKDIFQLIVSSFENISDLSSRSYYKRASNLITVAKVRSSVVMLDLECDELINEMFRHFVNMIRDYHPESIFAAMETIMTLVLEESEEISMELIHPILTTVKKDNQEVLPAARRLGERVIENSAIKLRPYMVQAVKSNLISVDDYTEIISNLCEGISIIKHSNGPASTGQLRSESLLNGSPKLIPNNGASESAEEGPESSKKTENGQHADHYVDAEETNKAESGGLENVDTVGSDSKQEKSVKNNGRSLKSSVKRTKPSVSLPVKTKKGAEEAVDDNKDQAKDIPGAASEKPSVEGMMPSEIEKEAEQLVKEAEQLVKEAKDVTDVAPSSSQSAPKGKVRRSKKETLSQDIALPANVSKEHGTSVLEEKLPRSTGKKISGLDKTESGTLVAGDVSSGPNGKKTKGLISKRNTLVASEKKEGKKVDQEKATPGKDTTSSREDEKGLISLQKSLSRLPKDEDQINEPDKSSKRKRGSGKDKVTDTRDYDADLVGSKVKVWWPKDKEFYEGVVDAYDPVEKKHKILYDDGDREELNLKKERWELIEDRSEVHEEQKIGRRGSDLLSKMHKKKKLEMDSDQPAAKQENTEPSQDMGSFSSKMKGVAKTLAQNSMDGGAGKKSNEKKSSRVKSDENNENKLKDSSKKIGKSTESGSISRPGGIKKNDGVTTKISDKEKQDNSLEELDALEEVNEESTPKGKTARNSKSQYKGKLKLKDEETVSEKESPGMVKELGKRKSPDAAKTSGTKTRKKT